MTSKRRQPKALVLADPTQTSVLVDRILPPTRGLLFIGDPHLASYNPGRRRDASYRDTVLGKLAQAADYANARDLQAICPGDLLDDHEDRDQIMQVRLARVLQRFQRPLVCTVGNHDKSGRDLTEKDVLTLMGVTRTLDLMETSGFWGRTVLTAEDGRTHRLVLGFTPYGYAAPTSLAALLGLPPETTAAEAKAQAQADTVVWITHADYAFENTYPGAAPLVEIPGVDLVINGHMHGVKKPVQMGETVWYCPGNITRMSVDQADHVPQVWAWSPFDEGKVAASNGVRVPRLEGLELRHTPGAETFSFEGRLAAVSLLDPVIVPTQVPTSAFVTQLKTVQDDARTDDGHRMREELTQVTADLATPDPARAILERLANDAWHAHRSDA
jgi:hypothetical protein